MSFQLTRGLFEPFKKLLLQEYAYQSRNFIAWLPILFALGIGFYFSLKYEPPLFLGILCISIFFSFYVLLKEQKDNGIKLYLKRVIFLSLIIISGFIWVQYRTILVQYPVIEKPLGPIPIVGTIENIEYLPANDQRFMLKDLKIERLQQSQTPQKIRLRYRGEIKATIGDKIEFLGQLHPPSPPNFPGGFDFQRYAFFRQIGAVGFIYGDLNVQEYSEKSIWTSVQKLREYVVLYIDENINKQSASLISALMVGSRTAILEEDVQAMRDSGLAHILAISGLHLGLVCGSVFFFIRLLLSSFPHVALHYPIKKYAALVAIFVGFLYMLMAGATIPTQRAFIMSVLFFGAILFDRSPFSLRFVAIAALTILILSPHMLLSASFQMSFAAVTALVVFYDRFSEEWSALHRSAGFSKKFSLFFLGLMLTTVIASFATAPFALFHFHRWSILGLLGNLCAIPILTFWVMPLIVISFLLMPLGLAQYSLEFAGLGVTAILDIAHWIASLPYAVFQSGIISEYAFLFMFFGMLSLVLLRTKYVHCCWVFFICAFSLFIHQNEIDILLSSRLKLIGIYHQEELFISSKNREKFARENWESLLGLKKDSHQKFLNLTLLNCDDDGCRAELESHKIAISKNINGQKEDCLWADLVIAQDRVDKRKCQAKHIIDPITASRDGAYAIYIKPNKELLIKTVKEMRGQRPWTF